MTDEDRLVIDSDLGLRQAKLAKAGLRVVRLALEETRPLQALRTVNDEIERIDDGLEAIEDGPLDAGDDGPGSDGPPGDGDDGGEGSRLDDRTFRALLTLVMVRDMEELSDAEERAIVDLADDEASNRGYESWVVPYHEFDPEGVEDDV